MKTITKARKDENTKRTNARDSLCHLLSFVFSSFRAFMIVLFTVVTCMLLSSPVRAEQKEPWLSDYILARKLARESGRPLFVVFRCQH